MQHYHSLEEITLDNAWLTIGSFDGVHRGHQEIIKRLTIGAHNAAVPAVVLTFFPHPSAVIRKRKNFYYLTSPEERASILGSLGTDVVITHPFNQRVANYSAQEFMGIVQRQLHPKHLVVGHDFALGRGREGNVSVLRRMGSELGFTVETVSPVNNNDAIISSSNIRDALAKGDVQYAHSMLGRPYQINGKVIPGDGRGKSMGIPTANLDIWKERVIPKNGVYACYAHVNGTMLKAVTNIGIRPTFESSDDRQWVEAHLLNYENDLYGKTLKLDFIARLRDEMRFQDLSILVNQIHQDIREANSIL